MGKKIIITCDVDSFVKMPGTTSCENCPFNSMKSCGSLFQSCFVSDCNSVRITIDRSLIEVNIEDGGPQTSTK